MGKILVIGSGISGGGATNLLKSKGKAPVLFDANTSIDVAALRQKLISPEIEIVLGEVSRELEAELEMVVLSPGVPLDIPLVNRLRDGGLPISGEIELAYGYEQGEIAAITGTNGKTTTTTLVGDILKAYYDTVFVVGNIGNPYTTQVCETTNTSKTVAEISSFQLETARTFKPKVSAILNITPDHLNRHYTMENYAGAKEKIALNQSKEDWCVLNYDNAYTRDFGEHCPAKVIYFSSSSKPENGLYLEGEDIYWDRNGEPEYYMNIHDMNLVGVCNIENVMAAIAIATGMGVPKQTILDVIRVFKAVEHRIEFVATKRGVDYYNDSKGTNPDAAIQGIRAMSKPTVLIGGGYDKNSEYDEWIEAFGDKVKCLVLIGQTREKIRDCAVAHGIRNIILEDTFEAAFATCVANAKPGDAVLLSPACASWGMFPNYEVRGKMFKEMVHNIEE